MYLVLSDSSLFGVLPASPLPVWSVTTRCPVLLFSNLYDVSFNNRMVKMPRSIIKYQYKIIKIIIFLNHSQTYDYCLGLLTILEKVSLNFNPLGARLKKKCWILTSRFQKLVA